jgi:predicted adenine nucleotide alpha hydrolase (AANH) superfamily ATPase
MKLLLHTCCAPCLIHPVEKLRQEGCEVIGLFYNPNIHPLSEYNNRKHSVEHYSQKIGLEVIYPDYLPVEYFRAVNMMEDRLQRCPICWYQRLKMTAQLAKEKEFSHFSSTLLVSPYQDIELIQKIGNDLAKIEGVGFYFEDFRPGFKKAHNEAKALGIYCQKYCGCIYSEVERCRKSAKL